jgi:hypothetical protein
MVGKDCDAKPMLEPFFVMGEAGDVRLMLEGFLTGVFNRYRQAMEKKNAGDDSPDDGKPDMDNG